LLALSQVLLLEASAHCEESYTMSEGAQTKCGQSNSDPVPEVSDVDLVGSPPSVRSKLVTWLALTAFVVAAVSVTALAGSSVPSTLLREHPRSESERRELRRYGSMSIWMNNPFGGSPWDIYLVMRTQGQFIYKNSQTRYVSGVRQPRNKKALGFFVSNLPASKGKEKLINYDIDTNAGAATYTASIERHFSTQQSRVDVYISTFSSTGPFCPSPFKCTCNLDKRKNSKYIWVCDMDFTSGTTNQITVTAV